MIPEDMAGVREKTNGMANLCLSPWGCPSNRFSKAPRRRKKEVFLTLGPDAEEEEVVERGT